LEATWDERAKMLSKLKLIRRAQADFANIMMEDEIKEKK